MDEKELVALIDKAIVEFSGDITELEKAIGMLMVGRQVGWKPLLLIHDKKTVKKYEKYLGIDIRKELPPEGKYAEKSIAYVAVKKIKNFWKAVKGEIAGMRTPEMVVVDLQRE